MNIENMTIVELKALAYEQVKLLKQTEINLQIIEQEISKKEKLGEKENGENNN